jgi:hypothetical protein
MPFTDDDLKRLKELLEGEAGAYLQAFGGQEVVVPPRVYEASTQLWRMLLDKAPALLARLEAESRAADLLQLHYESGVFDDLDEGDVALIVQALESWRKAAGK